MDSITLFQEILFSRMPIMHPMIFYTKKRLQASRQVVTSIIRKDQICKDLLWRTLIESLLFKFFSGLKVRASILLFVDIVQFSSF